MAGRLDHLDHQNPDRCTTAGALELDMAAEKVASKSADKWRYRVGC